MPKMMAVEEDIHSDTQATSQLTSLITHLPLHTPIPPTNNLLTHIPLLLIPILLPLTHLLIPGTTATRIRLQVFLPVIPLILRINLHTTNLPTNLPILRTNLRILHINLLILPRGLPIPILLMIL